MTLTELSYYVRKYLPFAVLFFLIFMIFFYIVKIFFIYLKASRTPAVNINPVFGKIKRPQIKEVSASAGLNFILDTIEGQPITATPAANVYFLPPQATRFGYREKIYLMAKTLGFNTEMVKHKLEGQEAIFSTNRQKLTIDITNFNFSYEYKFENDKQVFTNTIIPSKTEIENKAIDFLKTIGRYPEELARGKTNVVYLHYNPLRNSVFVPSKPEEANVVEIDFYRPDIDQYPIVSPQYFNSQNFVIMVFRQTGFKILKAQIRFFERSEDQVGVYPVRTGQAVWEELKAGGGIIVSSSDSKDVIIKKMFMAYLDPDIYQDYLQPVYVFLGENNFVAFVPAIANEYFVE